MRVYWPMGRRNHTVVCTPATDPEGAGVSDFLDPAGKPRQLVLQLRQLNLQLALAGARVAGKDVQD